MYCLYALCRSDFFYSQLSSDKTALESDFLTPNFQKFVNQLSAQMSLVQILLLPSVGRCFSSPSCS